MIGHVVIGITRIGDLVHRMGGASSSKMKALQGCTEVPVGVLNMSTVTEIREPEVQAPIAVWQPQQVTPIEQQVPIRPLFSDSLLETSGTERRRHTLANVLS